MKFSTPLLALALAAASFSASADTLNAYEISKHQATFTQPVVDERYDFYLDAADFPQPVAASIGWALTEVKFKNIVDIAFATNGVKFFDHADQLIWQGTPTGGTGPADTLSIEDLLVSTTHFYLTVEGTAVGSGPTMGSYSFEIMAAPVPEPQAYGMALAGLAVLGTLANKRRMQG